MINDFLFNTVSGLTLLALAVRMVVALEDKFYSRASFCFVLNLLILRLVLLRWYTGATKSTVTPDTSVVGVLSDPTLLNVLVIAFAVSVVWVAFEEYQDARERHRLIRREKKADKEEAKQP